MNVCDAEIDHGSHSHTEHIYDPVCTQDCQSGMSKWFRFQHNMLDS